MIRIGETIHSALPQDIPWYMPDHAIFFAALYGVLLVIGGGLAYVILKSMCQAAKDGNCGSH